MTDNDTIDGLLAEFRGYSAFMPPSYHVTMSWADFRRMLDRFEAAHRRERGDCAKLREALDESRRIASDLGGCRLNDYWKLNEIVRVCEAALAAPPRNCDKYPTFNDAIRALADKRGWHDAKWDSERYCILASWLYAPATEKEGANDGNE